MIDRKEDFRKRVETQLLPSKNEAAAKNALALLFPSIESAMKTYVPSSSGDVRSQKASRRISQKDFAATYFSLNPEPATWGRTEFERLISEGPDRAFATFHERVESASPKHRTRLRRLFLELLDAAFGTGKELTQNWLDKILAESPNLLSERDTTPQLLFTVDNEDRLRWLITNALEKLEQSRRVELLKNAIRSAEDLTVLTDVVRGIVGDKHPDGARNRDHGAGLGESSETIRAALLGRVKALLPKGKIWDQARPSRLLWFWWGSNLQPEVQSFTKSAMRTKKGLLGMLEGAVSSISSSSEGTFERVDRDSWSRLVDIDTLVTKAKRIEASSIDDRERAIATRFLSAVARNASL